MKIVAEKSEFHRFALYYPFTVDRVAFCKELKESFGWKDFSFESSGSLKRWVFSKSLLVPVIKTRFPEVEIDPAVESIVAQEQAWTIVQAKKDAHVDHIKTKTDTEFHVKGLKKELYPYQKVGVEFLVASGGRAIVADAPGLGKTAQAIATVKHSGFKRILVISPASVKFAWENEVKKWTQMSSLVVDGKTDISKIDPNVNFWIINYDVLRKHHDQLSKIRFDCVIGDECQYIKSTQAIRTKAFRSLSRNINSIILLSGTPLLSRPSELFSLLNVIDPKTWSNPYDFYRRYCDAHQTRWGMDTSGSSNEEELHSRIRRYFIRRDKTEVLKELPPKVFINVPVELDAEYSKKYSTASDDLAKYLRQYSGKQPPEIAKTLQGEKLAQLNVLRQLNAMGKIGAAKELIESVIDAGEKILVFSSFVEPLEALQKHFGDKAVILTGQTPVEERQQIVETFQNNKEVKVFFGGIKSAGIGITLTAASNVAFLDYSWTPSDMIQAADRVHRPGQIAKSVNIYQLYAKDTVDEDLKDMLDYKQGIFDQIIDGKLAESKAGDAMEAAVQRVLKKKQPVHN